MPVEKDLRKTFGQPILDLLAVHQFSEIARYDDDDYGVFRDYANGDCGIRLEYSMQGKNLLLMPRDRLNNYVSIGYIIRYLAGESARANDSFEDGVRFVDEHYPEIRALLSCSGDGSAFKDLEDFIYRENARRFGYDDKITGHD